jgi:single-strand DNA-binding protein
MNKVLLVGNLGKDPELRATPSGKSVASFTLATNERWVDATTEERKESTEWHEVEVWGRQAEAVSATMKKGKQVLVEGRIRTDKWEDKETGQPRSRKKIVADSVVFLGTKPSDDIDLSVAQPEPPEAEQVSP